MQVENSQLGKKSAYISKYTPELLFPIPRKLKRDEIGIDDNNLPFYGLDIWNHYEVSWLNPKGKPMVAIAVIEVPAISPCIIESKSMKLYFNSFNNYRIANENELASLISKDLSAATQAPVKVKIIPLQEDFAITQPQGLCLDDLDIEVSEYTVNPGLLKANPANSINETVYSNLLKSNCLVTNQPDWATLMVSYQGPAIEHESLLQYIISFRNHNEFHEQCVERVFNDILNACAPSELTVWARFTRRGGMDINPVRSTNPAINTSNLRLIRQ